MWIFSKLKNKRKEFEKSKKRLFEEYIKIEHSSFEHNKYFPKNKMIDRERSIDWNDREYIRRKKIYNIEKESFDEAKKEKLKEKWDEIYHLFSNRYGVSQNVFSELSEMVVEIRRDLDRAYGKYNDNYYSGNDFTNCVDRVDDILKILERYNQL